MPVVASIITTSALASIAANLRIPHYLLIVVYIFREARESDMNSHSASQWY
jgi:hypothetical protein